VPKVRYTVRFVNTETRLGARLHVCDNRLKKAIVEPGRDLVMVVAQSRLPAFIEYFTGEDWRIKYVECDATLKFRIDTVKKVWKRDNFGEIDDILAPGGGAAGSTASNGDPLDALFGDLPK